MTLHIPPDLLAELVAHCRAALPLEACGFLAGRVGVVSQVLPAVNELASPTAFRTEAHSTLAAFRAMRAAGTDLLAVYHSHPTSEPVPSRRDLAENTYGEVPWVIVGFAGGEPAVRAWRLAENSYTECRLTTAGSQGWRPPEPLATTPRRPDCTISRTAPPPARPPA